MKILTVCRMNQARSVFSKAVLDSLIPGIEVFSAGVEVTDHVPPMPLTKLISHRWGLEIPNSHSTNVKEFATSHFDLVLVAENWMKSEISCGYSQILSYEDIAIMSEFLPCDPELLEKSGFEIELAKVFWVSMRALSNSSNFVNSQITAVIPEHESLIGKSLEFATHFARSTGAFLVDAEVRTSYITDLGRLNLKPYQFTPTEEDLYDSEKFITFQINEQNSGRYFLFSDFYRTLSGLSRMRPLVMVTAPIFSFDGPLYDSFFASAIADDIRLIRQFS